MATGAQGSPWFTGAQGLSPETLDMAFMCCRRVAGFSSAQVVTDLVEMIPLTLTDCITMYN